MFLWFVVLLSEARGAKDIAEAVGMPGVSVFLAFLPVDRIHKIPKIIIRTICGLSVMLAVLYLLLAQLPGRRIFPHSRGEAIRYLEQEFPGETLTISREPIRYVDRGCMQTAWESSFRNYLIEMGEQVSECDNKQIILEEDALADDEVLEEEYMSADGDSNFSVVDEEGRCYYIDGKIFSSVVQ